MRRLAYVFLVLAILVLIVGCKKEQIAKVEYAQNFSEGLARVEVGGINGFF